MTLTTYAIRIEDPDGKVPSLSVGPFDTSSAAMAALHRLPGAILTKATCLVVPLRAPRNAEAAARSFLDEMRGRVSG